ncbi:MAG: outer rane lipoprotein LolB [Pseudomonadota bacterium]|jgi:outer membrane lipoprotein LolB
MKRLLPALAALLLAACAGPAPRPSAPISGEQFNIQARFALKTLGPDAKSLSGRLDWQHQPGSDALLFATPTGQGVAELQRNADGLTLRDSQGRQRHSRDPAPLLRELVGYPLPLERLAGWLLGRPDPDSRHQLDNQGRLARLFHDGWQIDYFYDDDQPAALPARLTLQRDNELELRLRIESWQ